MPFYGVRQGREPGVYITWDKCHEQVHRFNGAQYKKFNTHSDAEAYVKEKVKIQKTVEKKSPIAKLKISNNIPTDLMKESVKNFSAKKIISSYEKLTLKDTNTNQDQHEYTVAYSDGCCFSNGQMGSRAGYGVYWGDDHLWNTSERLHGNQTNQRAELAAAISAMEVALLNNITHLEIRTDSKYTIKSATEWIQGWKRTNWIKRTDSKPVINKDLMMKIDELQQKLKVKWTYVAGHSSNKGNDEADRLAKAGAQKT